MSLVNAVNFVYGTKESYDKLATKDANTLYFIDGVIYKGSSLYSNKIVAVSALPDTPEAGVMYVLPDYTTKFYTGSAYATINVGTVGTISEDTTDNDTKTVSQGAVKAYVAAKTANIATSESVKEDIATAKNEAISAASEDATTKVNTLKTELQAEITAKVASVFKFKGSKDTLTEVESLTDMMTGDVWHVNNDGKEYVYTGTEWELLGFTIDLSSYATTSAVTEAINAKATEIIEQINAYNKTEVDSKIKVVSDSITLHTSNVDIHVTTEKKAEWDAKATTGYVDSAKTSAIETAATDATTKSAQALEDAKTYADGLNSTMSDRVSDVETALTWGTIA